MSVVQLGRKRSASRMITDEIVKSHKVTFLAKLQNFSKLPHKVTDYVRTNEIEVNGRSWSLKIFPGGYEAENKDFISCFLCYCSELSTKASFSITLLSPISDQDHYKAGGGKVHEFFIRKDSNVHFNTLGWPAFLLRSTAIANFCDKDDQATFKVEICVIESPPAALSLLPQRVEGKRKKVRLSVGGNAYTAKLFCDPSFADIHFKIPKVLVGNYQPSSSAFECSEYDIMPGHKIIICAASEVFQKMLTLDTLESNTNAVIIRDHRAHIVKEMLRFIYKGHCKSSVLSTEGAELMSIAAKYDISLMVRYVEQHFINTLDYLTVLQGWSLSQTYSCKDLESAVLKYICENKRAVMRQREFRESLTLEGLQKIVNAMCNMTEDEYKVVENIRKEVEDEGYAESVLQGTIVYSSKGDVVNIIQQHGNGVEEYDDDDQDEIDDEIDED